MATPYGMNLFRRLKNSGRTADGSTSFINEWDAVRYLGRGNFGVVYEIEKTNKTLGEQHSALKIIELDEKSIEKYKDEIAALNSIRNHPHGVSIEDFSELHLDEGDFVRRYVLIRMELLKPMPADGMSEEEVIQMALDVSDVLTNCHGQQRKILHCDIKPVNILMTEDRRYKLSDFGEARFLEKSHGSSGMRGTPLYMSPEMASFKGYDERSDLYSLGVTMYAMLNGGCVPFYSRETGESGERNAIRRRLAGEKFPRIKGVRPELLRIINKLCEIDPNKRYQRAILLNRDLKAFVQKKEDERIRKEKAEAESRLKAIRKAEAAKKREEEKQRRENDRRKRNTEKTAARSAQLEKQNENLLLGETVSAEQRRATASVSFESTARVPVLKTRSNNTAPVRRSARAFVIGLVVCVLLAAGVGTYAVINQLREYRLYENTSTTPLTDADRALAEEFSFERTADGCRIIGYKGNGGEVSIPDSYNGYPVVSIGGHAFSSRSDITVLAIPESITDIGDYAFYGCSSLKELCLPDSVTRIGAGAFYGCSGLTSFTVPSGVTAIEDKTFYGCFKLLSINLPDRLTDIGEDAFYNCNGIALITLPDSLTTIGSRAFACCYNLYSLTIPESVSSIGRSAFNECISLESVDILGKITIIDDRVFSNCHNLRTITIPDSVTSIGDQAFNRCLELQSITLPDNVTNIKSRAFYSCTSLTSITIPSSVTTIGGEAFAFCDSLTSITIQDSVTSIGEKAFAFCSNLFSITIPNSVTFIGREVFQRDSNNFYPPITITAPHESSYYNYTPGKNENWRVAN